METAHGLVNNNHAQNTYETVTYNNHHYITEHMHNHPQNRSHNHTHRNDAHSLGTQHAISKQNDTVLTHNTRKINKAHDTNDKHTHK